MGKKKIKALEIIKTFKAEAMKLNFEERKEKNQQYHSKTAFSKIIFIGKNFGTKMSRRVTTSLYSDAPAVKC